jgi:hypothetical protein
MSVSTEKCTPGDRGKQLQVSHPGSTVTLKTMKLSFIKIIIIFISLIKLVFRAKMLKR